MHDFLFFQQLFSVAKAKRQLQMSPASIGGEMIPDAIMPRHN
ncbi:hypothetical protein [Lysinibacillus xylanilyticus]